MNQINKIKHTKKIDKLFSVIVLLPLAISALYFGGMASDVYISESRFVITNPERASSSGIGAILLKEVGFARSNDGAFAVQNYITSRDALIEINARMELDKTLSSEAVDFHNRFGFWDSDKSFEALYRYYQSQIITVAHDNTAAVTVLKVRAYSAEEAKKINEILLEQSEKLINKLNERSRNDIIRSSEEEVKLNQEKAYASGLALSNFRNKQGVIDPERQSTLQIQQIIKLQDELLANKAQLKQLETFTKNNPQIPALQQRVQTLEKEVTKETNKVAGAGQNSLAGKAAEYQRLILEREIADRQLAGAIASLEVARNEALRKHAYLERIAQPSLPDRPTEPRRLRGILSTLLLSLILWGIVALLVVGIKDHRD